MQGSYVRKRHQPQIGPETTSLLLPLAIGIGLILINAYWIALVSGIHHSLNPAYASLFIAPIVNLFFLVLLNTLLKRFRPQFALSRAQLLIVYQMLVMLCLVSGHNPMDFILGILAHPFWFATFENEYAALFHRYIPSWFTIQDKSALSGFFEGNSTLYTAKHLLAWIGPTLIWSFVTFVLFFILMCFNSIQRVQWSERERLSYPIAQLPIEMTTPRFFSRRLLWLGFGICATVELLNGLHFLYPFVPSVPLKIPDFGAKIFTTKPWSAIGWLPLFFYPWVIGLTFFVPLELSFSVWFFFLFTKFQLILGSIGGWKSLPGLPLLQSTGHRCMVDAWDFSLMGKSKTPENGVYSRFETFDFHKRAVSIPHCAARHLDRHCDSRFHFPAGGYVCRNSSRLLVPLLSHVYRHNILKGGGRCALP